MALLTRNKRSRQLKYDGRCWLACALTRGLTASLRLRLEWEKAKRRSPANGLTVDVSHSGCMAVIGADVPLRRQVRLVLPETVAVRKRSRLARTRSLGSRHRSRRARRRILGRQDLIRFSNDTRPAARTRG